MRDRSRPFFIVGFLLPAAVLYGVFVLVPVIQAVQYSTYDWSGVAGGAKPIGLQNFQNLFRDEIFLRSIQHNLFLAVVGGAIAIGLSLIAAHAIQGTGLIRKGVRAAYLLPHITSIVAVSVLWMFIFNPNYGLFTGLLNLFGLGSWSRPWLGDKHTALPAVGLTFIWYMLGFYVMLFGAGIKSIDHEVFESAELVGSFGWHRFWKITWPLLWSIKRVAILNYLIGAMNTFALVQLMTNGGPDRSSEVTMTYLYQQGFQFSKMGYASAIAVTNLVIVMSLTMLVYKLIGRNPSEARR